MEQLFFWIFWPIFAIASYQSLNPLYKQRKQFPKYSKQRKRLAIKAVTIGALLYAEAIAFVIGIFDLMGNQIGNVPAFQTYDNLLGIVFVLSYIFVPFCLAMTLYGPQISKWVVTSPHRENIE